jgi:chaperonin GroEL
LPHPIENQGCQLLKQACIKTNDEVGDGTTATALLALEMLKEGRKIIASGYDPNQFVREVKQALNEAEALIDSISRPVTTQEELEHVALIACNGDVGIAKNLAEATMAVGKDGMVLIEDGQSTETTLVFKDGFEIKHKGIDRLFRFKQTDFPHVIEGAIVAVINEPIMTIEAARSMLEEATQWLQNPLVIFAPVIEPWAVMNIHLSDKRGKLNLNPFLVPEVGSRRLEILEDIAAVSRATLCDPLAGYDFRNWQGAWFGTLRKVTVRPDSVTLEAYPEANDSVQAHLSKLKALRDTEPSEYNKDRINERIAKLSGGLAVLKVGDYTEAALKEKRARVEDALGCVRSALKGGVVPGGGKACLYASEYIHIDTLGAKTLAKVLTSPLHFLSQQTPRLGLGVWEGYDITQGQYRDLSQNPMIADPTLVILTALRSAISVSSLLLTLEVSVINTRKR